MQPNPFCSLCSEKPCGFHAQDDPRAFVRFVFDKLKQENANGLKAYFTAGIANLQSTLPPRLEPALSKLKWKPVYKGLANILENEQFTADDLREIAAICLTLVTIWDAQGQPQEQEKDINHG